MNLANIHLRADLLNSEHQYFTIFIGGKNCGRLCMGPEEAAEFRDIIWNAKPNVMLSGEWSRYIAVSEAKVGAALEAQIDELRKLLAAAHCPNCDGSGVICASHRTLKGEIEHEPEPCQWCYERKRLGAVPHATS